MEKGSDSKFGTQQIMIKEMSSDGLNKVSVGTDTKRKTFPAAVAILIWFACSLLLIFGNKYILVELEFPFPITLTSWHLLVATVTTRAMYHCTSGLADVDEANEVLNWRKWSTAVLPIGCLFSVGLGLMNYSYLYLSVSFIQMVKSGTPIGILLANWIFRTSQPNLDTFLNILVICFGIAIASYAEIQFSILGLLLLIAAICTESVRLVLLQKLLKNQGIKMGTLTALYYIAPVCLFCNVTTAIVLEVPKITWEKLTHVGIGCFALNGLASFGLNVASVSVVKYTSTVVLGLSGLVKDIIIVVGSAQVFRIPLTTLQWFGYGISLVGIARYKFELNQLWKVFWPDFLRPKSRLSAVVCGILLLGAAASATLYFIGDPNHTEAALASQETPARRARLARKDTLGRESSSKRKAMIDNLYHMGEISWPNYFDDLDSAALAPLTREVQEWIFQKQNPPKSDCRTKKFIITGGWCSGLGSMIHVLGKQLADALEIDRIFMLSPTGCGVGQSYVEAGCGRGEPYSNLECLVQPLSSCSIADATAPGVDVINATVNPDMVSASREAPTVWRERLAELHPEANLTEGFFRYWWRAQSAAYITRLNSHTSQAVRIMRHNSSQHAAWSAGSKEGKPVPYPLPTGTVSLHVRHGDKAVEMDLIPFEDYVNAAKRFTGQNPLSFQRRLFVSSEDPEVIEDARSLPERELEPANGVTGPASRWEVYTSNIPRKNTGPFQQLQSLQSYGKQRLSYAWLLQLLMALECDAWIGTRGSNWNRLIDELRCVYVDRCVAAYIEVGHEKDWLNYSF